jgi:hypothetical protein
MHATNIEFRDARMDDDRNFVRGRIDVMRGPGREERFQFACALNPDSGQVRSVKLDPMTAGFAPGAGSPAQARAMENCRRGVTERLRTEGYGRVEIGDMRVDNRPGRGDWLTGDVKGLHGNTSEFFNFACSVDLRDGDVRSVDVTRR